MTEHSAQHEATSVARLLHAHNKSLLLRAVIVGLPYSMAQPLYVCVCLSLRPCLITFVLALQGCFQLLPST
jgi:hypothetical protein